MSTALVGLAGTWLLTLAAGAGVVCGVAAVRGSGVAARMALWVAAAAVGGSLVSVAAMEWALVTRDFSLSYVADNGAKATPLLYTVATLWAALEGSILLWCSLLAAFVLFAARRLAQRPGDPVEAWTVLVVFVVTAWFAILVAGPANPFGTVAGPVPSDGPGPNPLLQMHPLMAIHPPVLYLGFVGLTVPFARAVALLVNGKLASPSEDVVHRQMVVAWTLLGAGIVLGAWWSYEVLGWGGFWAWDPVENVSLIPWLFATAYLHAAAIRRRRRTMQMQSLGLICASFSTTILGTFLTRSGVLDSVHAFGESGIGPALLALFAATAILSCGLIAWRSTWLSPSTPMDTVTSREGGLLVTVLMVAAFALVVALGTLFPLIVEALNGNRMVVGRPYFDRIAVPLGMGALAWLAVAPRLSWRSTPAPKALQRAQLPVWACAVAAVVAISLGGRGAVPVLAVALGGGAAATAVVRIATLIRARGFSAMLGHDGGGAVAHLGFVVVAVAVIASQAWDHREEIRLLPGESALVAGHEIAYLGSATGARSDRVVLRASVVVDGSETYSPALTWFTASPQPLGSPSVRTGVVDDVYLTIGAAPAAPADAILLSVGVFPLMSWLWVGGGIMTLGGVLSAAQPRPSPVTPPGHRLARVDEPPTGTAAETRRTARSARSSDPMRVG